MPLHPHLHTPLLTTDHCNEVLDQEIVIGRIRGKSPKHTINKKFVFHIWANEYRVYHNGEIIDSGQALEELLKVYNDIKVEIVGKGKKLVVYGGLTFSRGNNKQVGTIVATYTKKKAMELLQPYNVTASHFRRYWCETRNEESLKAALAQPEKVLCASTCMGRDFK